MKSGLKVLWLLIFALAASIGSQAMAKEKIKIEKLADLPRHTYKISVKAVDFLDNDTALNALASQLKTDLQSDLDTYEIDDKTTLKDYYHSLGLIALLEGRYDDYLAYLDKQRALEDKEATKLTMGLFGRAYVKMMQAKTVEKKAFLKDALAAEVGELPYDVVGDDLKQMKAQTEIITPTLMSGSLEASVQPVLDGGDGTVGKDIAKTLVNAGYAVRYFIPYKDVLHDVLADYLASHEVKKADIWAARDTALNKDNPNAKPVTVCIWDSGLDTDIFKKTGQLWVNKNEIPDNGKDDDSDGYVDDVYGIAYDLHSNKITDLLQPLKSAEDMTKWQHLYKGISDWQSNVESPEADEFKKDMGSLSRDSVGPFLEAIELYGNHAHGTHVSGIAARGNPFIRLMISRLTFDYHMIPETPTVEQARKDSAAYVETLKYYKKMGVRVVNMSWGGSIADVEQALEKNNAGGTPEERRALARQIFEITRGALYEGIKNTPEILYICAAGNADNNVKFEEFIPSTFDLPNIMSVGAVDQAGDETSFTSFGKVDVYADGYEVESYVPGGVRIKMSGTSMASPEVTNLAAKILALRPDLTPVQVRQVIVNACDEHKAGDRVVKLINPKKSIAMLASMKEMGSVEN